MWNHLVTYPTPHGVHVRVKGRNHLTAKMVVGSMKTNAWSVKQASENFSIPEECILECIQYCQDNEALISLKMARKALQKKGLLG